MYALRDRYSPANETFAELADFLCWAIGEDSFLRDKKERTCLLRLEICCLMRYRRNFASQFWRSPAPSIYLPERSFMNRARRRLMSTSYARG